jgi:PPOX class probable FMN-dependent enzyme
MARVSDVEHLRRLIGDPSPQVAYKMHRRLTATAREHIARSPLFLLGTVDGKGQPMVSPKGDPAGFVHVEDDTTLLVPERKGNRLVFTLTNVLGNPRVALIFLVPGTDETLRVEGEAELLDDPALCERFSERGRPALLVMRIRITNCYFHCAKAFLRGALWKPETWPERMSVSFGAEIAANGGLGKEEVAAFDEAVQGRYRTDL